MCRRLRALSGVQDRNELAREAEALVHFLIIEIPAHGREEQELLLPLLKYRCGDDVHAREIFLRLEREHELDLDITGLLLKHLKRLAAYRPRGNLVQFDTLARSFSDTYSEHVEWESENLLPLLRNRLTKTDFAFLEYILMPQYPNGA